MTVSKGNYYETIIIWASGGIFIYKNETLRPIPTYTSTYLHTYLLTYYNPTYLLTTYLDTFVVTNPGK